MYLQSIKSVKNNAENAVNRSILKKSRLIGFGVFIVNSSMTLSIKFIFNACKACLAEHRLTGSLYFKPSEMSYLCQDADPCPGAASSQCKCRPLLTAACQAGRMLSCYWLPPAQSTPQVPATGHSVSFLDREEANACPSLSIPEQLEPWPMSELNPSFTVLYTVLPS